jgi:two-component system chemotaxis response regulator CheY
MADKRILLVEDSATGALHLNYVISTIGGATVVGRATNGVEAIRLYRELKPDVVLMDIVMPDMDGISALRSIMSQDPKAFVIMISSMGGVGEKVAECLSIGAKAVISKPFDIDQLRKALEAGDKAGPK